MVIRHRIFAARELIRTLFQHWSDDYVMFGSEAEYPAVCVQVYLGKKNLLKTQESQQVSVAQLSLSVMFLWGMFSSMRLPLPGLCVPDLFLVIFWFSLLFCTILVFSLAPLSVTWNLAFVTLVISIKPRFLVPYLPASVCVLHLGPFMHKRYSNPFGDPLTFHRVPSSKIAISPRRL